MNLIYIGLMLTFFLLPRKRQSYRFNYVMGSI